MENTLRSPTVCTAAGISHRHRRGATPPLSNTLVRPGPSLNLRLSKCLEAKFQLWRGALEVAEELAHRVTLGAARARRRRHRHRRGNDQKVMDRPRLDWIGDHRPLAPLVRSLHNRQFISISNGLDGFKFAHCLPLALPRVASAAINCSLAEDPRGPAASHRLP